MLVVVYKVEPWQDMQPDASVPRVSGCNALHVWGKTTDAVERLAGLDLGDHLSHITLDFAGVLREAVEADCVERSLAIFRPVPRPIPQLYLLRDPG